MGFAAGDGNLTRYVGNTPSRLTDPSGMEPPSNFDLPYDIGPPAPNVSLANPQVQELMASMNQHNLPYVPGEDVDWLDLNYNPHYVELGTRTPTGYVIGFVAEGLSIAPFAGEIRDVGEMAIGTDIWGNRLEPADYGITIVGAGIPLVPAGWLRKARRVLTSVPTGRIAPVGVLSDIPTGQIGRVGDGVYDPVTKQLKVIDEVCFVAGTLVAIPLGAEPSIRAEADQALSWPIVIASATVAGVTIRNWSQRKQRRRVHALDQFFAKLSR